MTTHIPKQPSRAWAIRIRGLAFAALAALMMTGGSALLAPKTADASSITFRGNGFSVTIGDSYRHRGYRSHRQYRSHRGYRNHRYAKPYRYKQRNHRHRQHYGRYHYQNVYPQFWYGPQK